MSFSSFAGIFPYIVSPVDPDGTIRERVLRDLVNYLVNAGVHGITPLGSTGEFYYLSWEQKKRIVEIVLDEVNGRVPVTPGVASSSTNDAVRQAVEMEAMGADGIVSVLNTYFPVKQEDAYSYFFKIADSVSCPVVLYNNPKFTHFDLSLSLLKQLSDLPNVNYYKDATGITGNIMNIINLCGDRIRIFSASAHLPVFVMMLGGVGWMSGPACLIPKICVKLYDLCRLQRWEEALALQKSIWEANYLFQKYNLAACIKAGLELKGFEVGHPIAPNAGINEVGVQEIRNIIEQLD